MSVKTKKIIVTISEENSQLRLDKALSLHPDIQSRSLATKLIHSGAVRLNGHPLKASHKTKLGEQFYLFLQWEDEGELRPYNCPLSILFEDKDILLINKPAGLVVHPAPGHSEDTLVNALIHRGGSLSRGSHPRRPGIVHRLDKETSGILVIAKNDESHAHLSQEFKLRKVKRSYWAIVFGRPKEREGKLSSFLARHPRDRKRYSSIRGESQQQGKWAVTHYEVLETFYSGLSLVQCQLETGRTHQIRVHLSEMGCPIIGDSTYGADKAVRRYSKVTMRKELSSMDRIGLHAFELGFQHPRTKEPMYFKSDWPEDFKELINKIR